MATEKSEVAAGFPASSVYPICYSVVYPEKLSRRKAAQRAVGTLITWIVPAGLGYISAAFYFWLWVILGSLIAFGVIILPIILAIRIRDKGPQRFLAEDGQSLTRYAEYAIAAASFALFLTDAPPRESLGRSVMLEMKRGGEIGWRHAAITPVLLLPHVLLLALFALPFMLLVPIKILFAIAFERYPPWVFGFTVGYLRWIARALGYWVSLTDRYPPFSFSEDA